METVMTRLIATVLMVASLSVQTGRGGPVTRTDRLPPWNPSMSDGCSVPALISPLFPITPEQREGCVAHDRLYYYGGSEKDRLKADVALMLWWVDHGMPITQAVWGFNAVRAGGGPEYRQSYSWAFGGRRFVYTASPAQPKEGA